MKRFPLILVFCAAPAFAQITVTPGEPAASPTPQKTQVARPNVEAIPVVRAVPVRAATPAPSATPAPKRKSGFFGFFRRLFGSDAAEKPAATPPPVKAKPTPKPKPTATPTPAVPKPTATPAPKATPKPTTTPKPTATPAPKPTATPAPAATATPTPKPSAPPKPIATPVPAASPKPTPRAVVVKPTPIVAAPETVLPPITSANANADRYLKLKEQALKDPQVSTLLQKMNALPEGGDAYKTAAHDYLGALFAKMRSLDASYEAALNRKEGAYKRRVDEGKPIVE